MDILDLIEITTIDENDTFYSQKNLEHLKKSIEMLEQNKGTKHELIEVKD